MKTKKQIELAEQLRDLLPIYTQALVTTSLMSPDEIAAHRGAYGQAKSDFIRDMEREPASAADFSAILRRAEAIRKAAL